MKLISPVFLLILLAACQSPDQKKADSTNGAAINEKTFITLGGEEQYVEITGTSSKKPVLLFIHGGPGWPQTPHLRYFNADLNKEMVVVAWEQSGCGKSFTNNPDPKNLSLDQLVSDAHELTQILKKKFKQDKIYLAGFSWGSMIGLKLVHQYPEDYAAYFGISQALNTKESIRISREWIRSQAKAKGDKETLKVLEELDRRDTSLCKTDLECFFKQYEQLTKHRGAIHTAEAEAEIEKAVTAYDDYKHYDWMGGFNYSIQRLQHDLFATDLTKITEVKIPVYFLVGRHDWTLPAQLTETFVNNLKAPRKEIIWFENSGHEPLEEEAGKFNQAMIELIKFQSQNTLRK